jgi:quinohemoprotein amine dehydrogenase
MASACRINAVIVSCTWFAGIVTGQSASEEGIPVTDPVVIAKCGNCHARDERGNMKHISWARSTPENWQEALKQMILVNGLSLTPPEARTIVKYLSARHGLAPGEARPVMYDAERRIHEETNIPSDNLRNACAKCHAFARPLSWRRSPAEWKHFTDAHAARHNFRPNEEAVAFLAKAAPLHTPEWEAWSARTAVPDLTGRWLAAASIPGRGKYYGEMQVDRSDDGEFTTRVKLTSMKDGSSVLRTGRAAVYGGYAWRGRSAGAGAASSAPDDLSNAAKEVIWMAPDQSAAEGRWFWGQYQEFGFDVRLQRPSSDPTLLAVDRSSLKAGSRANRIRAIGENFPAQVTPADLDFGAGVIVRAIVSSTPREVVAEVDVSADAQLGRRSVAFRRSILSGAIAIYDHIDYLKARPDSAVATFSDPMHPKGYQQFEAIGYQRGPDGKAHTADDLELGPVDSAWSIQVFHAAEGSSSDSVGSVSPTGLFTPATNNPDNNYDVWAIATARDEKDRNGTPLLGKSYMVVTVPTYIFNGRRYVRDLDRWIDEGPASGKQ